MNVLDYTSVVVPVTNVVKSVDKVDESFKAVDGVDQQTHDACKVYQCLRWKFYADFSFQMILRSTTAPTFLYNLSGGDYRRRRCWRLLNSLAVRYIARSHKWYGIDGRLVLGATLYAWFRHRNPTCSGTVFN